ncbi:hypothetical protein IGI04_029284, partial [Brassica rapa subsp. trilocularis]
GFNPSSPSHRAKLRRAFSQKLFPKALAFVVSCLLNVQPFVISCLRSLTDREVEMRVRSYTPSPSPPPRGHGRRGRSPSPTPRGGGPYRDLSATLFVRNLSHDCRQKDLRRSFGQFGPLKDINLPRDYYSGRIRSRYYSRSSSSSPSSAPSRRHHSRKEGYDRRRRRRSYSRSPAYNGSRGRSATSKSRSISRSPPRRSISRSPSRDRSPSLRRRRSNTPVPARRKRSPRPRRRRRSNTPLPASRNRSPRPRRRRRSNTPVPARSPSPRGEQQEDSSASHAKLRRAVRRHHRPPFSEVAMRGRSYTPSPSPPPRGHGRRGRSPSPSPRGGGRYRARSRDLRTSLFVRQLSRDCREEDLRKSFKQFGPLKDIHLPRDHRTGGYHIANYSSTEACVVNIRFRDRRRSSPHYPSRSPMSSRSPSSYRRRHSRFMSELHNTSVWTINFSTRVTIQCSLFLYSRRKEGYDRRRRSYSRSPASNGSRGRSASPATSKSRSISRSPRRSISRSPRRRSISRSPRRNKSTSLRRRRSNTPIPASRNRSRRPRRRRSNTPVPPARSRSPRGEQ